MILDEYVEVQLSSRNIDYYKSLGYEGKYGDTIQVKTKDLNRYSKIKIHAQCSVCKDITYIEYKNYVTSFERGNFYVCRKCANFKAKQTNLQRYGGAAPSCDPKVRDRMKNTLLQNYGVTVPYKSEEIRNKGEITCLNNYGVNNPSQSLAIQAKKKETCQNKYGVDNISCVSSIREKAQNTMIERYGAPHALLVPDFINKSRNSYFKNHTGPVSTQQYYLNNLFFGEINYPYEKYSLDIYLPKHKLDIEYNGGGHDLAVKLGTIDEKEFKQKEIIRCTYLRQADINQLTIISRKDYLPSDSVLLQMLEETLSYLSTTNHHWVEYDIDCSTVRNALGRFPYDFGALRKIKKTDVQDITQDIPEEAS